MSKSKTKTIEDESINATLLDQKIDIIAAGLPPSYGRNLQELPNQQNKKTIIEYISAMKTETNMSNGYRKENIDVLRRFSIFTQNKNFHDMTRDDILAFLDNCRRNETTDPLHKWIGTYNQYRIYLLRFFKWLYSPNIEQDKRKTPSVLENIPRLRRREVQFTSLLIYGHSKTIFYF